MKQVLYIAALLAVVAIQSCKEPERVPGFEDADEYSIYNYLVANKEKYSDFLAILEVGGLDKTLSAYNPNGNDYTLFLPDNEALKKFIDESNEISSLNDILNNPSFAAAFSRFHVVNKGIHTQDFPFGAFPEPTLSDDYLTVSFVIQSDTSYYKINNQAGVKKPNIELSNGYIHEIEVALEPITYTTWDWVAKNPDFTIFKAALDITGVKNLLDFNLKADATKSPVTLFGVPDLVYKKGGVNSFDDLKNLISPGKTDYTNVANPLYQYCVYHILTGNLFINDFEDVATNYTTLSEIPLNVNGLGVDLLINKGKQIFDTLVSIGGDTTIVDYIGFYYDLSNITSQSGSIHLIDQILKQVTPSRADVYFTFNESELAILNEYRRTPASYLMEDPSSIPLIKWSGVDLFFTEKGDENTSARGNDYFEMTGDFRISYELPPIVQGRYRVYLGAEAFNSRNALVEVYLDGKKISNIVDLTTGGSSNSPFNGKLLAAIELTKYESHVIEVVSLIPGRFLWDYVRFEPI